MVKNKKNTTDIESGARKKIENNLLKNGIDAVKRVASIADEKNAEYIKILNVGPRFVITDYFVIISAKNSRLTKRISEDISLNLKKSGLIPLNIDGFSEGNWILMDYDDFVVHIFTEEYRLYYDLERLWRDSKVIKIKASLKKAEGENPRINLKKTIALETDIAVEDRTDVDIKKSKRNGKV